MNQPQTIIHSLPGHEVPEALFAKALIQCPTVSGFAVRCTDDGNVTLESDKFDQTTPLDRFMLLNQNAKAYDAVYYMANLPGKHTKDDIQPYVLTIYESEEDKVGKDVLNIFIEGDLSKFSTNKDHTEEYNFYNEIVLETLQDLFIAADQDLAKFYASLRKPLFEKQMMAHFGHRGVMLLLPKDGDLIKFGNNELGKGFDWGTCSQHLNFDKVAKPITSAAQTAVAAVKKFNPFAKPGTVSSQERASEPAPVVTGVHATTSTPRPLNDPIEKTATAINAGKHLVKPPAGLDKSARNRWLRLMNNGDLPPQHDHKSFEGIWVTSDILPYAQRTGITTVAQVDALGTEIRTGVKKAPVGATEVVKPVPGLNDFLPVLSDSEMTLLTGAIAKLIDRKNVPTALDIQKMESKWDSFSKKAGIPYTDTDKWSIHDVMSIGHKALAMLWIETRRREMLTRNPDLKVADIVNTHVEAKTILKPDGTPAKTVSAADKRAALFGKKVA